MAQKITKKEKDFSAWYNDVVTHAELADYSPVKGCMVIRPKGYAVWEMIKNVLDKMLKDTGHENAYFPLFIPESFFHKEAEHVEGFSPEAAVVTIGGGKELEEKLMVRPTSETIMYSMYSKWINSYRDLPLLINQWANIVRWEMRTRLFLRTTEFLWQEGHTAHATFEEADEEALKILRIYEDLLSNYLAIPIIAGVKSDSEKFAGAVKTYCIEAMMGDKKALQAGTTHHLGDKFARAFNVRFQSKEGKMEYVWQTSWAVTTRLIGALIMVHGDNKGIILPPNIAPTQIVIIPIWNNDEEKKNILEATRLIETGLKDKFRIKLDDRDQYTPGWKFNEWELVGVPLRLELGPKDLKEKKVIAVRRDTGEKMPVAWDDVFGSAGTLLNEIQSNLLQRAIDFRNKNTHSIDSYEEFKERIENEGGFYYAHWCGKRECELSIKDDTKATIRVIPFNSKEEKGECIYCGSSSRKRVIFSRGY